MCDLDTEELELIKDLLPDNYSVLLLGPSGVGKLEYCVDLARRYLEDDDSVIFVTVESHTDDIRAIFERFGLNSRNYEGEKLIFIDCFSSIAGQESSSDPQRRTLQVSSLSNLEHIGMSITKAAEWMDAPIRVFFCTLSPLFFHNSSQALAKFFQIVSAQIRTKYGFAAYALHEGVHDDTTVKTLQMFVDGLIEMRFDESLKREMRIHHLKGVNTTARWISFHVGDAFVLGSDERRLEQRLSEEALEVLDDTGGPDHEP